MVDANCCLICEFAGLFDYVCLVRFGCFGIWWLALCWVFVCLYCSCLSLLIDGFWWCLRVGGSLGVLVE